LETKFWEPYADCLNSMTRTTSRLCQELAKDSKFVQEKLGNAPKSNMLKSIRFQLWRARFSSEGKNNERKRLIDQLKDQNETLRLLLEMSTQVRDRQTTYLPVVNSALCSFWKRADLLFTALAGVWDYTSYQGPKSAMLLLQHRRQGESDFSITFTRSMEACHKVHSTIIREETNPDTLLSGQGPAPGAHRRLLDHVPRHRNGQPLKSALKSRTGAPRPQRSIALSSLGTQEFSQAPGNTSISCLFVTLEKQTCRCYGYIPNGNARYYIYHVAKHELNDFRLLTLEHILSGNGGKPPTRQQRYSLSLTLASSVLQLWETLWMPGVLEKSAIFFPPDTADPSNYLIDQPYMSGNFSPSSLKKPATKAHSATFLHSLNCLGIVLLELCFGERLEDRPDLTKAANGNRLLAALEWHKEVVGETGTDYAQAVSWCLTGHQALQPDKLRQGMFANVVKPLEKIYSHLFM
jgi:hypothetical protein